MTWKSFTLNDLKGQCCKGNCIICSMSFRATRFYWEKYLQNLCSIFFVYLPCSYLYHLVGWPHAWKCSYLYRLAKWPNVIWQISFSSWLEVRCWASDVGNWSAFLSNSWVSCTVCTSWTLHSGKRIKHWIEVCMWYWIRTMVLFVGWL